MRTVVAMSVLSTLLGCGRLGYDGATSACDPACDAGPVDARVGADAALLCLDDADGDGFVSAACGGPDCADQDPGRPTAEGPMEAPVCADSVDNDCDGRVDLGDSDCNPAVFEPLGAQVSLYVSSSYRNYLVMGSTLYFVGDDGTSGQELWKTDGTEEGTMLVADINPAGDSDPRYFLEMGGLLYFFPDDGVHGREPWRSDGAAAGTTMVADINPTSYSVWYPDVVELGGAFIFEADDGASGGELWRSDGTAAGTTRVLDIAPGPAAGRPYEIIKLDATTAVFRAIDPVNGVELWRTDGTTANTQLIADIAPGAASSLPDGWYRYFARQGGILYYRGENGTNGLELWRTDGTAVGTAMVRDIQPGAGNGVYASPWLTPALGGVFFQGIEALGGYEPFFSDGSTAGTFRLGDLNPSGDSLPENYNFYFTEFDGRVFFRATDGIVGFELWVTDGTPAGTRLVADINPTDLSDPKAFFAFKNELYFRASDGTTGHELWTTDGTAAGTRRVLDMNPAGDAFPFWMGQLGDVILLAAVDETGAVRLWLGY